MAAAHDKILIVDFGSQVTQLIARRVREEGVYSEIVPFQKAEAAFARDEAEGGDPVRRPGLGAREARRARRRRSSTPACRCSASATASRPWRTSSAARSRAAITANSAAPTVEVTDDCALFDGVWAKGEQHPGLDEPWRPRHQIAAGLSRVAQAPANAPFAVIADDDAQISTAMQFHPEVVHTPDGAKLIRNFVRKVAGLTGDWTMRAFREEAIEKIRAQVGKGRVICGLSGGVDSAVAAVLIHEAIGDQLTCVFVDHGLLRKDEAEDVVDLFRDHYNIPLVHVDAVEAVPRRARRRHRPRAEAQDHRPAVHRRVRRRGARRSAAPNSWRRARSIPT